MRFTEAGQPLMAALNEFQQLMIREGTKLECTDVSLSSLSQVVSFFYGTEFDIRKDVVMVWQALKRVLNLEASLACSDGSPNDLFSSVAMLMQPVPFDADSTTDPTTKSPGHPHAASDSEPVGEPASVQETIRAGFERPGKEFRLWGQPKVMLDAPAILQIELHRQTYDKDARKWKKLTHKIALDETIDCNDHRYTLYGMVVHSGGLDYHEYYSIVRPEGPGRRWLKYAGETSDNRSLEVLTTKQAIWQHEGGESAEESASVAYVVIYIRSDLLSQVLTPVDRYVSSSLLSHFPLHCKTRYGMFETCLSSLRCPRSFTIPLLAICSHFGRSH